ncbi:arginine pathway regulatory protein ArgR, repressor of arg regulon [Vibrio sp. JCM 18905]|nr:arginine pathway regulatory protein ArgR, repressor of arg regulon [Vibrio sp. JCM 18905]
MLTKFGAVRTRNAKMEMVYCLPAELGVPTVSSSLRELVLDIDHNAALVVIHTGPGAAQLIARLLDSLVNPKVFLVLLQVMTLSLSLQRWRLRLNSCSNQCVNCSNTLAKFFHI